MPTSRRAPPTPGRKCRVYLKGRLFPAGGRARLVDVECQRVLGVDHPVVEGVFSGAEIQPHIHDASVNVRQGGQVHLFTVFCKNHCALPMNASLPGDGDRWKGDILIMRRGQKTPHGYVNLRSDDQPLIQRALEAFLRNVHQGPRLRFPKQINA